MGKIKALGPFHYGFTVASLTTYLKYLILRAEYLAGKKSFCVDHTVICTKGNIITIGEEYQYREGGYLKRAIIEEIKFRQFQIMLKVFFMDDNRYVNVSHVMQDMGYSGMWRIWDKDRYDLEEWYSDREPIDQSFVDNIPVIYLP